MLLPSHSVCCSLYLRAVIIIFSTLLLNTCAKEQIADPMCRIAPMFSPAPAAPAACLIKSATTLLVLSLQNDEGWQLPTGNVNNKKSAQCTAHQAVWQSTGLNVEVGQHLATSSDNLHYYACTLSNGFNTLTPALPVPAWAQRKVVKISFVNPNDTSASQWSTKSDLNLIQALFNKLN